MAGNVITVIQAHRPEGIDDPASRKVLIRPNPMRESATVTVAGLMTGQVLNYTLLDLTGRVMTRGSFTGNSTVIRQNALPGGIYLLRISDQSGVYIICTKLVVI